MKFKSLFIFCAIFMVASCNKSDKIKIGVIAPLTGSVATYGQDLKKGIDIAFDEDPNFKAIYQDSKANAVTGVNAMKQLHDADKINFFIGDATTTVTLAIGKEAQNNKSILLVPIATGNDIIKLGDFVFMNAPRNEKQSIAAENLIAKKLKAIKIGVIYQQIPYGVDLKTKFIEELKKDNITPLLDEGFQDAKTGLRNIILKAKQLGIDAVFMPMEYESAALLLKQSMEQNFKPSFVGTDGAFSEKLFELAGNACEGFYFTMFPIDKSSELFKSFSLKFNQKYNSEPNVFSCYGYETAKNLITAVKGAGTNTEKVKNYFKSNEFNSFTGKLKFDENGEVIRDYGIYIVTEQKFVIFQ